MKKAVAVLCVLLVAAVAILGVTLFQKNDLQARLAASESTVQALEKDKAEAVQALEDARQELEHVKADAAQAADEAAKAAQEAAQKLEETRADAARAAEEAAKELENVKADVAKELENVKASLQEQVNQAMEGVKAQFGTEAEPAQEEQPEEEAAAPAEEQPEEEAAAPAEEQPEEEAAAPAKEQSEEEDAAPAQEQPAGEEAVEPAQEQQPQEEAALPEYAVAYVMYESADPAVAYRNDGAETGVISMNAEIRDYGFYIVSLDFSQVEGGQAAGVKALALNILNGEKLFPGALVRVAALRVNGNDAALGKGCAYSEDGSGIRVDIYSENAGDPPAGARAADGSLDGAGQSLVDAALFDAVKTIEIEFELIAAQ